MDAMSEKMTPEDVLIVETTVVFGWRDRLRVLCRGRATLTTRTATEHKPGRTDSLSTHLYCEPIIRRKPRSGGQVTRLEGDLAESRTEGNREGRIAAYRHCAQTFEPNVAQWCMERIAELEGGRG